MAKEKGAIIFGVCNVVGSSIPRTTHEGVYTHAGPEISVASTKAFTAQLTVMTLIALSVAKKKNTITKERFNQLIDELMLIPEKIKKCLELNDHIKKIAEKYSNATSCLFLGRGYNFPVALEGALKLKEISYIHAEGYPAAEMKHGPIALIEPSLPSIFIATKDKHYEKVVSNIQEVKARSGKVIALVTEGDTNVAALCDDVIFVPEVDEILTPLINVIPMQLLSYHVGVAKGLNVDQPRNLAKSVTVE
jgi:glucosamine--fructose-6-phosphate aminotransferase (isomerizing)